MQNCPESTSRHFWWPTIRELAKNYEKVLIENFGAVQLIDEKLENALKIYELGWWSFKEQVYKKNAKNVFQFFQKNFLYYVPG